MAGALQPAIAAELGGRLGDAVGDEREHRVGERGADPSAGERPLELGLDPELLEQPLADERQTPLARPVGARLLGQVGDLRPLRLAGERGDQPVELAGAAQAIEPPQVRQRPLPHPALRPVVLDQLQGAALGAVPVTHPLLPHEHDTTNVGGPSDGRPATEGDTPEQAPTGVTLHRQRTNNLDPSICRAFSSATTRDQPRTVKDAADRAPELPAADAINSAASGARFAYRSPRSIKRQASGRPDSK